jgi:hypothetical protein
VVARRPAALLACGTDGIGLNVRRLLCIALDDFLVVLDDYRPGFRTPPSALPQKVA